MIDEYIAQYMSDNQLEYSDSPVETYVAATGLQRLSSYIDLKFANA